MKNIKKFLFIALVALILNPCLANGSQEKESFYSQLTRTIVRLEHLEEVKKEGSGKIEIKSVPEGTAFFVWYEKNLYIITARHVVDKDYDLHARVKCRNRKTGLDEIVLMKLSRANWIFHPEQGDKNTHKVEVAVMKIYPIKDRDIKHFSYYTSDKETINQFAKKDPEPPKEVLVFGFPENIGFELRERNPMGRKGIIALKEDKPFIKIGDKFIENRAVLVDVEAFPGNSGSPVISISAVDGKIKLEGLLIATNVTCDYAVIEPISRIREVLEIAKDDAYEPARVWIKL